MGIQPSFDFITEIKIDSFIEAQEKKNRAQFANINHLQKKLNCLMDEMTVLVGHMEALDQSIKEKYLIE